MTTYILWKAEIVQLTDQFSVKISDIFKTKQLYEKICKKKKNKSK